jgi:hypothetical protein
MHRTLIPTLLLLSACTAYSVSNVARGPLDAAAPPPAGLGMICVLRPHSMAAAVPAVVRDNAQLVGGTRGAGHFCYLVQPGEHVIKIEAGDDIDRQVGTLNEDHATVTVAPGTRHYLHETLGSLYGPTGLQWVDEATGLKMASDCPYALLTAVPGKELLPTSNPVPALATQ